MAERNSPSRLLKLDARRVCVIKPSALGDVIQSLPLLPVLRERFPRARISWVISRPLAPLLEGHPDLDEIILFDRHGGWSDWRRLLRRLHSARFDLVFDLQGLFRTAAMTWSTRADLRVGLETAREGSHLACHFAIPDTGRVLPAHLRYRRVADALGVGHLRPQTRLSIPRPDWDWASELLSKLSGPALAIHPGAQWTTKRWPPERFAAIACKAVRRYGLVPLILGGPGEEPLAAQVEQTIRRFLPAASPVNLAGQTSLKRLAAVLHRSSVLLTNDSGPMHLAAELSTPVVGVFTCTNALRSGPAGDKHELVSTEVRCAGSYRKQCPYRGRRHMACMEELDVERVWSAFCRVMHKNHPQKEAA